VQLEFKEVLGPKGDREIQAFKVQLEHKEYREQQVQLQGSKAQLAHKEHLAHKEFKVHKDQLAHKESKDRKDQMVFRVHKGQLVPKDRKDQLVPKEPKEPKGQQVQLQGHKALQEFRDLLVHKEFKEHLDQLDSLVNKV
jgi:hypothetical protein